MKRGIAILCIALATACSEGPSKSGEDQLPLPAQNSGPSTEADRAIEAVKDSANSDNPAPDSLQRDTPKK